MAIAIFGGAFDPFHIEHRKIIASCKEELNVDKVIVVPSYLPPHKSSYITPFEDRFAMVKAGTKDLDYVIIDTIENKRETVNPTNIILPILKEKYQSDKLYFVIGGDSMVHFHTWIKPEVISKMCTLAVIAREGYDNLSQAIENAKQNYNSDILVLNAKGAEVSSSIIKATIEVGSEPQNLQKEVFDIIKERKLYNQFSHIIEKLKREIPIKTFNHSVSTTLYAMKFVAKLKLNYDKVFLSCILHDAAKHIKKEINGVPPPVVHQYLGAEIAQSEYGITDEEILSAIKYHTSGKPNMTTLEKLVYVADMVELSRKYERVEILRAEVENDFEKGFVLCVKSAMDKLLEEKNPIYPLTKSCLAYYTNS